MEDRMIYAETFTVSEETITFVDYDFTTEWPTNPENEPGDSALVLGLVLGLGLPIVICLVSLVIVMVVRKRQGKTTLPDSMRKLFRGNKKHKSDDSGYIDSQPGQNSRNQYTNFPGRSTSDAGPEQTHGRGSNTEVHHLENECLTAPSTRSKSQRHVASVDPVYENISVEEGTDEPKRRERFPTGGKENRLTGGEYMTMSLECRPNSSDGVNNQTKRLSEAEYLDMSGHFGRGSDVVYDNCVFVKEQQYANLPDYASQTYANTLKRE